MRFSLDNKSYTFCVGFYLIGILAYSLGNSMVRFSELPGINTAFYRMLGACICYYPLARKELAQVSRKDWLLLLLIGALLAVDMALWTCSLYYTRIIEAQILSGFSVLIVSPVAYFLFKERLSRAYWPGFALSVIGALLLTTGGARLGSSLLGDNALTGNLMALASALFYAVYFLSSYRLRQRVPAFALLFITTLGSLLPLCLGATAIEGLQVPLGLRGWWPILGLVLGSNLIGMGSQMLILGRLPAGVAGVLILCSHPFSAILAWVMFDERLNGVMLFGLVLVLVGAYLVQRKPADTPAAPLGPKPECTAEIDGLVVVPGRPLHQGSGIQ